MEGKGMSRAAQKKRKRENKQKKQFALKEVVVKDEDHESEEEPTAESDDDIEQPQITKLPKIDESILFNKGFNHQFSLENFSGLTLQDIFNLRDVQDVTAHQRSSLILSSFLRPVVLENFYEDIWQKKVYRFRNENNERNKIGLTKLCNKKKIKKIVTENIMRIDEDVRILESNSPDPSISMDGLPESSQDFFRYFLKGKTMILLQPQKYEDSLWKLYSMLEYEFNSRVDGNLILQPENTTYFEPTYDADRFLIQLEGKSSLRYPSTPSDLSVFLSTNNDNEDTEGSVWNKLEFESNDVLYVPQGFPIEINSDSSTFSLTLLISTNRKNSVADLLQFTVPTAIGNLKPQLSFLNMSLPTDTRTFLGVAACDDDENPKRKAFCSLLQKSLDAMAKEVIDIIDPAVDQMGKAFIMERLPVPLSKEEELLSSHSSPNAIIHSYTQLRVVRPGVAIAVVEDGKCVVYHCVDNSRELFGNPINPLEFDLDDGPAIEALLSAYPHSVTVSDLEHPSDELDDKIGVAQALYKEGILLITDVASRPEGYESETNESDENGIL